MLCAAIKRNKAIKIYLSLPLSFIRLLDLITSVSVSVSASASGGANIGRKLQLAALLCSCVVSMTNTQNVKIKSVAPARVITHQEIRRRAWAAAH